MPLSTFWNAHGEPLLQENMPYSLTEWHFGEPQDDSMRMLLARIEAARSSTIVHTSTLAMSDRSLVLDVDFEDSRHEIVRVPFLDAQLQGHSVDDLDSFESEVSLLIWLQQTTSITVPRVLSVIRRSDREPYTFFVMQKMGGECLMNVHGALSLDHKKNAVRGIAEMMLELSKLNVPQRMGTARVQQGVVNLIALTSINKDIVLRGSVDTISGYMQQLIDITRASSRVGTSAAAQADANRVLERLQDKLPSVLLNLDDPIYTRFILNHDDLNDTNVLLDEEGHVTGILDWEFNSTKPLVLAAAYPSWLRYDGINDPRFANCGGTKFWLAGPEDSARLRSFYANIIKAADEDYWRALVDGEVLRQIEEWLTITHADVGLAKMEAWMNSVFPTL